MFWVLALVVFTVVLSRRGRIGPFVWDPSWRGRPALCPASAAQASGDEAERILARRLADGDLTVDDYYERLSLIQSR